MLEIPCDKCGEVLSEPGALLFSPPDASSQCTKIHLCVWCWQELGLIDLQQKRKDRG